MVTNVFGESSDKISLITINLDKDLKDQKSVKISEHGRYIQVEVPNTIAAKSGSFYESNSPYFKKMALFETSENETALRIFTDEETHVLKSCTDVDIIGKRIIISLDHKKLLRKLQKTVSSKIAGKITDTLSTDLEEPVPQPKTEKQSKLSAHNPVSAPPQPLTESVATLGTATKTLNLASNMKKVAIFIGLLFLFLLFVLTYKRITTLIFSKINNRQS